MIQREHWLDVCPGLLGRGVCEVYPIESLCHIGGRPLLNGMFSVGTGEFKDGVETQRLILNLILVNHLCRSLGGYIGEVALLSSEDIGCFFYLFEVPEASKKFFTFSHGVPPELVPQAMQGRDCALVSRVLPMGFDNAVSIAQQVHRNAVRWSGMALTAAN